MNIHPLRPAIQASALALTLGLAYAAPAMSGEFSASFDISDKASVEDTGLPVYPGATVIPGKKSEGDAANVRFSIGEYGLKVVAAKLSSGDSREKVAAFYQDALARFGKVLDCTNAEPSERRARDRKSRELDCEGERAKRNGFLFKAGLKRDQRVVSIETKGDATVISLVHVEVRGLD